MSLRSWTARGSLNQRPSRATRKGSRTASQPKRVSLPGAAVNRPAASTRHESGKQAHPGGALRGLGTIAPAAIGIPPETPPMGLISPRGKRFEEAIRGGRKIRRVHQVWGAGLMPVARGEKQCAVGRATTSRARMAAWTRRASSR